MFICFLEVRFSTKKMIWAFSEYTQKNKINCMISSSESKKIFENLHYMFSAMQPRNKRRYQKSCLFNFKLISIYDTFLKNATEYFLNVCKFHPLSKESILSVPMFWQIEIRSILSKFPHPFKNRCFIRRNGSEKFVPEVTQWKIKQLMF